MIILDLVQSTVAVTLADKLAAQREIKTLEQRRNRKRRDLYEVELTWIGKDKRPRLEPRILLEDPALSHSARQRVSEGDIFDNMLIHGDNLLALKALEQDFSGKVRCVYIDPPFNTGQAFEHYDDGIEHSVWLSLMRDRLELLRSLLSPDGTMVVHIDDEELGYLIILLDEVFGRSNRCSIVTFKQSSVSGPKSINPGLVTISNFLIFYAKDKSRWAPNRVFVPVPRDDRYNSYIENFDEPFEEWRFTTLRKALASRHGLGVRDLKTRFGKAIAEKLESFVLEDPRRVIRLARVQPKDVNADARRALALSLEHPERVCRSERHDKSDYYFRAGQQLLFYSSKAHKLDGRWVTGVAASTMWDDLLSNNLHNEGGVRFPKGKKPEGLIKRVLELTTAPGDLVLDSFAGSGTTGAVAHKLKRRWLMVELGDHCTTHVLPRLRSVVDGTDTSGITQAVEWKGGGGFRFYRLAPSLLKEDKWGNWVINKTYNKEMLAEAMCKLQGFRYAPSQSVFWVHGQSTEQDFIYVTTQTLTHEQLQVISAEVGPDRSLLICCAAFRANPDDFPNLTITKIPAAVLARCVWGKDDYSLNVQSVMGEEPEPEPEPGGNRRAASGAKGKRRKKAPKVQELHFSSH